MKDKILDIPIVVSLEVGRKKMTLEEISEISKGDVIKLSGEEDKISIYVNDLLIGVGKIQNKDGQISVLVSKVFNVAK